LGRLVTNVWNFFRSEQAIQDEVILEINDAIDRHFLSIESSVRNSVEIIKEKQKKSLRNYCDKHIKLYRRRVEKLIKKRTQEKNRIESCINANKNYINKISNLQEILQKEISLLLTT
jgi:NurA-like 5'-3' nuclease